MVTDVVDRWWRTGDGIELHARDYAGADGAAAIPVFCLHGLTRNARDFEDLAPALAATGRRVLAFDVRGRGRSGRAVRPQDYATPVYVADLQGFAAALGVARADVVSTSMGGLITLSLAAAAPGLVGDVVLNDVGPEIAPDGLARILSYVGVQPAVADWREAATHVAVQNADAFPRLGAADWVLFARRLFREEDGRPVLDYDPRIAEPLRAASGQPAIDLWPLFEGLAHGRRILLVRGERSDILTEATAERMAAVAPRMRRVDAPHVGHAPTLSEPQVRAALLDFLAPGADSLDFPDGPGGRGTPDAQA